MNLHTKYGYTPTPEAMAARPRGTLPIDAGLVGMEINGLGRHAIVRDALGAENLDFLPPPKGPKGVQTATVGGNAWSILADSSAKEAAWKALRWIHTREGMLSPQINAIAWPPLIWAMIHAHAGSRTAARSRNAPPRPVQRKRGQPSWHASVGST
ncbi:MAG TPA: hypothetical protein VGW38_10315 [Chloroflexota bacterium]|nr:hypothetical protein [Chloroflexota bacterium]